MNRSWLTGFLTCAAVAFGLLAFGWSMHAEAADQGQAPAAAQAPATPAAAQATGQEAPPPGAAGAAAGRQARPAAGPLTGRFACVDVIHVLNEFQRQRDLLEEINQYSSKLQAEDTRRKQEIDKLQAEVDKLDPEDPTAVQRMRQLLQVNIEYKNWREMKQADTGRELGLWSIRIYNEVARAVEDVARRDGYDFVFYKGQFVPQSMDPEVIKDQIRGNHLLYNHPALEITQAVLDKLNGDYRAQPRQPMLLQTP